MIQLKVDVLDALKDKGYSSYRLRKDKILGESVLTKLRNGVLPSWHELDIICGLLDCQPGILLEYVPDTETPVIEEPNKRMVTVPPNSAFAAMMREKQSDENKYHVIHVPVVESEIPARKYIVRFESDEKQTRTLPVYTSSDHVMKWTNPDTPPAGTDNTQEQPS